MPYKITNPIITSTVINQQRQHDFTRRNRVVIKPNTRVIVGHHVEETLTPAPTTPGFLVTFANNDISTFNNDSITTFL